MYTVGLEFYNLNTPNILCNIKVLSFNTFISENLWIYHLVLSLLFIIIAYYLLLIRKTNRKKKFIEKLSLEEGPLSPRNLLPTLIDAIPDYIYIKDTEGRFIVGNKYLAESKNLNKAKDLIGKTDYDFYPKELANNFRLDELEMINSGKPLIANEEKGLNKYGEEIWISTTKIPIKDENFKVVGIAGLGRVITKRKLAEEELLKNSKSLQEANVLLEERQEEILNQQNKLKTQAAKLSEEKDQLFTLINSIPDRIYIKDRESRFIIGNIDVAEIMGAKKPEDLIGKTDFDFHSKEFAEAYYHDEQEIMSKDFKIINKEEPGINIMGEKIVISTTKVPVKDKTGTIIGLVGIGRDITQQKETEKLLIEKSDSMQEINVVLEERQEEIQQQAEELKTQAENLLLANQELEKLSIVASKTDNLIVIMDEDGNFEWVNDCFVNRYGMGLDEFMEKSGKNLRDVSLNQNIDSIITSIKNTKKPLIYNAKAIDKNGKQFWSQSTISPIMDENGEIKNLIAIDADISKLKEAEMEIEKQRDELKILNGTKDKFFSIIAHDLKNPFHSIMGFSDLLSRSYNSIEDEKKQEFIKLINESSTSAYGLLENLLNWARTQTNRIKFEPEQINLRIIIKDIFQMVSVNAENKNIKLLLPEDEEEINAFADYNMVNTVVRNLVSNALKFTETGGSISVYSENKGDRIYISVSDTGVGMNKASIDKLFRLDEFHTSSGTSGESGTGLGLIVCREFVLKHGGDIEVNSEVDKGSIFTFSLPLNNL